MTPKEKAIELVDKNMIGIIFNIKQNIEVSIIESAKKCSIITVNEVINACEYNNVESYNTDWWLKVKQEIEKL